VLIATPGRLNDFLQMKNPPIVPLNRLKYLVLDEVTYIPLYPQPLSPKSIFFTTLSQEDQTPNPKPPTPNAGRLPEGDTSDNRSYQVPADKADN